MEIKFTDPENLVFSKLQHDRKVKKFTDVKVKAGNIEMDAHRKVLEKASPVIKTMLEPQWFNGNVLEFNEEKVDPEILEDLMNLFYGIPIKITAQNVFSLCIASHFLDIPNLLRQCEIFLCPEVSLENVIDLYNLSKNLELTSLKLRTLQFLARDNKNIPKSHKFLNFTFDEVKEISEDMIDKNKENPFSKENAFFLIVSWVEYDFQSREALLPNLLQLLPLKEFSDAFLMEHVFASHLAKKFSSCSKVFEEISEEIQTVSQTFGSSRLYFMGRGNSFSISYMNLMNGKSRTAIQTPGRKCSYATTVIDKKIYFFENWKLENEFENWGLLKVFDCENYSWKILSRTKGDWEGMAMTSLNGILYVSGGHTGRNDSSILKTFSQYSLDTNTWTELKKMNEARYDHKMIALNGLIYAIGGRNKRSIERYDPTTNEWSCMKRPEKGIAFTSVALHHNKIYYLAYYDFHVFDPENNTFQILPRSPNSCGGTLVSINDKLLFVSNFNEFSLSKSVFEFHTANNSWSKLLDLDYKLEFVHAVVVNF